MTTAESTAVEDAPERRPPGVAQVALPLLRDARGVLTFAELERHLPFTPVRYFAIMEVPPEVTRGHHAHRITHQFFVVLRGGCTVELSGTPGPSVVRLDRPTLGLHAPPLTWVILREFTEDALVLVLASESYSAEDYIHDPEEFQRLLAESD